MALQQALGRFMRDVVHPAHDDQLFAELDYRLHLAVDKNPQFSPEEAERMAWRLLGRRVLQRVEAGLYWQDGQAWWYRAYRNQLEKLQAMLDNCINDRVRIERVFSARKNTARKLAFPVYFGQLQAKHQGTDVLLAGDRGVVVKAFPFFGSAKDVDVERESLRSWPTKHPWKIVYEADVMGTVRDVMQGMAMRDELMNGDGGTPHMAIVLDAFVAPTARFDEAHQRLVVAPDARPLSLYQITERGETSLGDFFALGPAPPGVDPQSMDEILACAQWQVVFTLYAQWVRHRRVHGDPHWNNIFLRKVTGTVYAGRDWVYVLPGPQYVVVPAQRHRNWFVEIIDFGRTTSYGVIPPDAVLERAGAANFLGDLSVALLSFYVKGHHRKPEDYTVENGYYLAKPGVRITRPMLEALAAGAGQAFRLKRGMPASEPELHRWPEWLAPVFAPAQLATYPSKEALLAARPPGAEAPLMVGEISGPGGQAALVSGRIERAAPGAHLALMGL